MRRVCAVDVSAVIATLHLLDWKPGGDPGTSGPIEDYPPAMPVNAIFGAVAEYYPGRRRGLTCFAKLIPGQFIERHCDRHDGRCRVRVHVPITTNQSCVFLDEKHAYHFGIGWAWEIDPTLPHCVGNAGDTERVHLFFNMRE